MTTVVDASLREQLLERRDKLQVTASMLGADAEFARLLDEVNGALARLDDGSYGLCEVCHDPIEADRLLADPLVRFCLGDLTPRQQQALEEDLELAVRIQKGLLPPTDFDAGAWQVAYRYQPAGFVSGDYCDLIKTDDGDLYFILGDVSGHGMAASLLMSNLQAMFRVLIPLGLTLDKMVERASRLFCENTLATHYATLVCGKANRAGEVELCNAGHLPPLLIKQQGDCTRLDATGLPIGLFCDEEFATSKLQLAAGDALLLYTDGLTETTDGSGVEFGIERLIKSLSPTLAVSQPEELINSCVNSLAEFRSSPVSTDDLTVMAIKFAG